MEQGEHVIVVSNRLPLTIRKTREGWKAERSSGGLATAMDPVLQRTNGTWIGWPGDAPEKPDAARDELLRESAERERFVPVDLPPEVAHRFYEGFSNQTLWPLFHHFPAFLNFDPKSWQAYRDANLRFRDAVVKHLRPGALVWIHDYQLMLLPQLLREAAPDARIGFFLHIPFPSREVFRLLPRREEVLNGLLGADLLAFHTHSYLQHFRNCLLRIHGLDSSFDRVAMGGRVVKLEALPIGIAPGEFVQLLESDAATMSKLERFRQRFKGQKILLGVDRLDYTKGIPERLRAFRCLLERAPELRGHVRLVQVAVPSRERVPSYSKLSRSVNELVGEINGDFGTLDWTPILYIHRGISRAELVALYAAADVGLITPLRDGMNLVAKEYVACKRGEDGVLILSEFAGAAAEMGEALLVNPYDEERTAEVIERALSLSADDRRERMSALYRRVTRNNVYAWSERFLAGLRVAVAAREERAAAQSATLPVDEIVSAFRAAPTRLLLLDYDGTLVPYANRPRDAVPPPALNELLARLASNPSNCVIVVSGRPRVDLEKWFGGIRGLWLAAEHGAIVRPPAGSASWEAFRPNASDDWKEGVRPVLEHFVERTPGSFVEEKEFSLVWHYRMSDPEFGEWLANELVGTLEQMLAATELRAVRGQKSVEVKPAWANKGEVLPRLAEAMPEPTFRFAAGDDRTDEDLFEHLPDDAWTIHVGGRRSRARFFVQDTSEVWRLLTKFVEADESAAIKRAVAEG